MFNRLAIAICFLAWSSISDGALRFCGEPPRLSRAMVNATRSHTHFKSHFPSNHHQLHHHDSSTIGSVATSATIIAENNSISASFALLISTSEYSESIRLCGASILDGRWLLTAAHCIHADYPRRHVAVREYFLGRWRVFSHRVADVFVHPDAAYAHHHHHNNNNNNNNSDGDGRTRLIRHDLALLRLQYQLAITFGAASGVLPVCLLRNDSTLLSLAPELDVFNARLTTGLKDSVHADGGNIAVNVSSAKTTLAQAARQLFVLDDYTNACELTGVEHARQLCVTAADGKQRTRRSSTSGVPLMARTKLNSAGLFVQVGVASTTYVDRNGSSIDIYTRVSPYTSWIESIMAENSVLRSQASITLSTLLLLIPVVLLWAQ